jgi:hypothetical protein
MLTMYFEKKFRYSSNQFFSTMQRQTGVGPSCKHYKFFYPFLNLLPRRETITYTCIYFLIVDMNVGNILQEFSLKISYHFFLVDANIEGEGVGLG